MARNMRVLRIALFAALAATLIVVPTAFAGKGGGGGKPGPPSGGSTCGTTPRASVTNTWAWGSSGSWAIAGQQVGYHIIVFNDDVNCGSSTFNVSVVAPSGFSVTMPQSALTLGSGSTGYLWAYVTSPLGTSDGDYPLSVVSTRGGATGSSATLYKVYSSDSTPPRLYYATPSGGSAITGRSTNIGVASSDDHAVKKIDLYLDGSYKSTSTCDGISYECQLSYNWSTRGVHGQHTATFYSYDWMGNVGTTSTTFTVN